MKDYEVIRYLEGHAFISDEVKDICIGLLKERKEARTNAIEEFAEKCNQKITEFILEHQNQITFVSGVSMGWKIIDEIAESMKGEKE